VDLEIITRNAAATRFPPVVFVHGGFHAAWCWDENFLPYFSDRAFDTYAPSLRGHGNSDGKDRIDDWGLTDYVDDLRRACAPLRSPPILVGHSTGAVVVQQYVQSSPASAMVMIAPTPLARMSLAKLRWAVRFPLVTAKMLLARDINRALPALRDLFFSADMSQRQASEYMRRLDRESNRLFRDVARIRDPNPQRVRLPALILAAARDRVPQAINRRLADAFDARLVTLPVAHDVMLCPQWQTAADRIIDWLTQLDRGHRAGQGASAGAGRLIAGELRQLQRRALLHGLGRKDQKWNRWNDDGC
jgi:pimeloyl-ACP methyl ester carboxylesterase